MCVCVVSACLTAVVPWQQPLAALVLAQRPWSEHPANRACVPYLQAPSSRAPQPAGAAAAAAAAAVAATVVEALALPACLGSAGCCQTRRMTQELPPGVFS